MCELTENYALIWTAIIAFFGVTITATMSYVSNYRMNKKKIEHEEKKLKQTFLRESFDNLMATVKELRAITIHVQFSPESKHDNNATDIFHSIKPFIPEQKGREIEKGYEETAELFSDIMRNIINGGYDQDCVRINDEISRKICVKEFDLNRKLIHAIDDELSLLAEKLRAFVV